MNIRGSSKTPMAMPKSRQEVRGLSSPPSDLGDKTGRISSKLQQAVAQAGAWLNETGKNAPQGAKIYRSMPLTVQGNRAFKFAIIVSLLFHAGLLFVKFGGPQALENLLRNTTLEVVLINAKSDEAPTEYHLIAQHSFVGGGSLNQEVYATSPFEYSAFNLSGETFDESSEKIDAKQEEGQRWLAEMEAEYASLPKIDPNWATDDPRRIEEERRRQILSDRIATLTENVQEESRRPKRRTRGPAALGSADALYFDAVKLRIKERAAQSYPEHNGKRLYGELQLELSISPSGETAGVKVIKSSGNPILDRQTEALLMDNYGKVPEKDARRDKNIETVVYITLEFSRHGGSTVQLQRDLSSSSN